MTSRLDGWNGVVAVVQRDRVERGQHARQLGDRIIGAVGIGDVALHARYLDPHVDRAAAADLDDVAEPLLRGRLADQDHVGPDVARRHPAHQRRRAVGRRPFLVAGDDQAQPALLIDDLSRRGDEGGDAALHVDRAAAI